jgi:predicted CXXCH cytochrome family protein
VPIALALLVVMLVAILSLWGLRNAFAPTASSGKSSFAQPAGAAAGYVGGEACAACHAEEAQMWRGSHHDLAMQEANAATVLGDFADRKFAYNGIESRFFQRDGKYFVHTDGPDGKLADYAIKYTFGVWPLQQYLIEFPGGRLQTLSIAWDARSQAEGGQRWFHLYPSERIDHKDSLHWTGIYQNWNLQCAECHSTNLRKGYDAASNSYKTTYSEPDVACEACHGPGSAHVDWASRAKTPYRTGDDKGLAVALHSRWSSAWRFPQPGAKIAQRDQPADPALMNSCAACHARRSTLNAAREPGAPLSDSHRLALLTPPLYYADGQQHDEVYVWGSFLQSRMYQKGVTCMDCHEAHTSRLRVQGNALCLRCHNGAAYNTPQHHFHKQDSTGAQCVECHMPAQDYMVVDARRDHGIRRPRPDLSQTLGSPNACTQCHADKKPAWAASAMDQWYGKAWRERPHYGTTLHAGVTQGVKAVPDLLQLAQDSASPAVVRATAATLLQPHMRPDLLGATRSLLRDADPEVRIAALGLIEAADPVNRLQAIAPLLQDRVRGVRIEAARILADLPDSQLASEHRSARQSALDEYLMALQQDADWPTANVSLGNLHLRQGNTEQAIAAYERALALDAQFAGAYVNLADAYRVQGQEDKGEQVLRRGLARLPRAADLQHALGLLLVRKGDKVAAAAALEQAARHAPGNARYAYVYAVALHSTGQIGKALSVLRNADGRHPNMPDILGALVSMHREAGDNRAALNYARKLAVLLPENQGVQQLVSELGGTR